MPTFTNHHLTAEHIDDLHGPAIMLTQQEGIDDPCTIVMHPWQLVAACKHLGLTTGDPQAAKTIATLQRRMVTLRDRIEALSDWTTQFSNHKHADLGHETTQLDAIADLAREWCHDFEESEQTAHPSTLSTVDSENPAECSPAQVALL